MTDRRGRGGKPPGGGQGGGHAGGSRPPTVKVRSAKGRRSSSTRWLQRQLNDPFVAEARRRGYRSRAAFKLLQLDERFDLLRPGLRVLDLGAAPGGWAQVAAAAVKAGAPGGGRVVAVDPTEIDPLAGVAFVRGDIRDEPVLEAARAALGGPADLVLSDMAPGTIGHAATDHLRIVALAEAAYEVAAEVLAPGGAFVCKVRQGGAEGAFLAALKRDFASVRHAKPEASRAESAEAFVVAQGFRPPETPR
jgi:23S rRNA (uridine2552-2'-O)-methyltransferase